MTDWREELIEAMAKAAWESDGVLNWEGVEFGRKIYLLEARAALAVAEPVIREQCAEMADAIAKDYRVYRDHFPHAEGAEQVAATIRDSRNCVPEGGKG